MPPRGGVASALLATSGSAALLPAASPWPIGHATADSRVAVTGSYALSRALRDNAVPVKFIAYPGPGHSPPDPVRQRDVNRRWVEWLERYLDGER